LGVLRRPLISIRAGAIMNLSGPGAELGIVFIILGLISSVLLVMWTRERARRPEEPANERYLTKKASSEIYRLLKTYDSYDPIGCMGFNLPLYLLIFPILPIVFWKPLGDKRPTRRGMLSWWIVTWLTLATGIALVI
jgi:hypothetical protein